MTKKLTTILRNDLLMICITTLVFIVLITVCPSFILRLILGIPFVFIFPGYTLSTALFPGKQTLSPFVRVAYSISFSIISIVLIGFILNYVWSINLYSMLTSTSVLIFIASIISWQRRRKLPEADRISPVSFRFISTFWSGKNLTDKYEYGIKEQDLKSIANKAFTKGRMDNNIVDFNDDDITNILYDIY